MNDKMGGDLDKIKVVGQYLIEVWSAAGMDMSGGKVVFKWASDEITSNASTYWPKMLDIARRFNVTRIKKCCQIMGRLEGNLTAAQILYPLMQCTDVFFLKADVCQLGVDQRKVNMLAREYCDAAKIKFKPVILSHHMLYGLKKGQEKMSKSDPDSAIFMEDTPEDVERKITAAYCPRTVEGASAAAVEEEDAGKESMQLVKDDLKNPCLDYIKHIVLCPSGSTFDAGGITYDNFAAVKADYLEGRLSEADLKAGLIASINRILEPVRGHFNSNAAAKELLEKVSSQPAVQSRPELHSKYYVCCLLNSIVLLCCNSNCAGACVQEDWDTRDASFSPFRRRCLRRSPCRQPRRICPNSDGESHAAALCGHYYPADISAPRARTRSFSLGLERCCYQCL